MLDKMNNPPPPPFGDVTMTIDSNTTSVFFSFYFSAAELLFLQTDCVVSLLGGLAWMCGAARWSSPLRDMIRALLLSNDAILGWLTSQLTDSALLVSSG